MFQKNIVEKYLSKLDRKILEEKYNQFCAIFQNEKKIENIRNSKEEQYQEGFIRDLFVSVLGYTIKPEENYNILTELKNEVANKSNSKKSDGAICEENNENKICAVIELKGTDTTDLDKVAFQAFSYKNFHNECNYVIVSNFERLRIYVETQIEYEEFNLFKLSYERFCVLYLLLELNQLKADVPLKLKHETLSQEKQITDNFYADYSTFKRLLFEDLIENNPEVDKLVLFKKTQKLLDRILFILFCEDRNLLPANSVAGIISDYQKLKELGYGQPLYNVFKNFFDRIDKGWKSETDSSKNIFAYNGGLFKTDEILDNIKVGDDVLFIHTKRLSDYDFESQISVDILGRIFENSLTEIEEVQQQIEAEKTNIAVVEPVETTKLNNVGKRKKDGVFYTPEYITKYIVENTIGKLCEEKRKEFKIDDENFAANTKYTKKQLEDLDQRLIDYRNWLLGLKILDPACGSGAFLNAALRQLKIEHTLIDYYYANIHKNALNFESVDNDTSILENNLYGVDINEDSIEITKLSLWLHTAKKNRKLTTLNGKIKCGNSLIDDPAVAGEKAFNWEKEFPEVFEKGGFDVVIGNPPYVNIANITDEKYRTALQKKYYSTRNKTDLYAYFVEKSFTLVKKHGKLGFIIPHTWKATDSFLKFREILVKHHKIEQLVDLPMGVFPDAIVKPLIIILDEEYSENYKINVFSNISILKEQLDINEIKALDTLSIDTETNNNLKLIFNKIGNKNLKLSNIVEFSRGIKTSDDKRFISTEIKDECSKKVFRGRNIKAYQLNWNGEYIWYRPDLMKEKVGCLPHTKEFFEVPEKLVTQRVNSSMQLLVTYDNKQHYFLDTVNVTKYDSLNKNFNLKFILVVLNSKLINRWYSETYRMPTIGGYELGTIPIPEISLKDQTPFIELADTILSLNETFQKKSTNFLRVVKQTFAIEKPSTKLENFYELDFDGFIKELKQKITPKQKLEWLEVFEDTKKEILDLKQQIDSTDKEINQLVYKLYGLTDEEIAIVTEN